MYNHPEYGEVIDMPPHEMEMLAAKTIIQNKKLSCQLSTYFSELTDIVKPKAPILIKTA